MQNRTLLQKQRTNTAALIWCVCPTTTWNTAVSPTKRTKWPQKNRRFMKRDWEKFLQTRKSTASTGIFPPPTTKTALVDRETPRGTTPRGTFWKKFPLEPLKNFYICKHIQWVTRIGPPQKLLYMQTNTVGDKDWNPSKTFYTCKQIQWVTRIGTPQKLMCGEKGSDLQKCVTPLWYYRKMKNDRLDWDSHLR